MIDLHSHFRIALGIGPGFTNVDEVREEQPADLMRVSNVAVATDV